MKVVEEFRTVKAVATSVRSVADLVSAKMLPAEVSAGAYNDGEKIVRVSIDFGGYVSDLKFPGPQLARCLAVAIEKNIESLLTQAAAEADLVVEAVKAEALAEAQAVIREIES